MGKDAGHETVHCILDWFDGPTLGVADIGGRPHVFQRDLGEGGSATPAFLLSPLAEDAFAHAMEDWSIWLRWEVAFHEQRATIDTHPALPEDRARHEEIQRALAGRLSVDRHAALLARAEFKMVDAQDRPGGQFQPHLVRWREVHS
ncbi:MAG: hypothetical protein L6R43_06545 [Planctomycetes bacterium]|nr:hypothetical protein [Planctomycetota bacterium]